MGFAVFVVDAAALEADVVSLTGDEGRHAAAAMRVRPGETIVVTDGRGAGAECVVRSVAKHEVVAEVARRVSEPPPAPRLTVAQAMPKGEHGERAVDLLTEVGVDVIVPWAATRNVVVWDAARRPKALARWRGVARAAGKQSRRLRFPDITDVHETADLAALAAAADLAVVLDEAADHPLAAVEVPRAGELLLVVGPEGGVTAAERDAFAAAGAVVARLGPTVLRSSSAGIAAAAALLSRTPRWS